MFHRRHLILGLAILLAGCSPSAPQVQSLTDAQEKFVQLAKEELNTDAVLFPLQKTLWIYVPTQEKVMDFKVQEKQPEGEPKAAVQPTINFLKCETKDGVFDIRYDISESRRYAQDTGYSVTFSEKYQTIQRGILSLLTRIYGDVDISNVQPPDFFIIVIADITTGIETRTSLHFADLRRGSMDFAFGIEYVKRMVNDYPQGDPDIIGDKEGKHLELYEMTWPKFLTKQIEYRIRLGYQYGPEGQKLTAEEQILKNVKETLQAYRFNDYQAVDLRDLEKNSWQRIDKEKLQQSSPEESP